MAIEGEIVVDVPKHLERYTPPGDSDLRDKMLDALDFVDPDIRVAVALHWSIRLLRNLAINAPTPTQKRMCEAYVDAFDPLIPADVRTMMNDIEARVKRGEFDDD